MRIQRNNMTKLFQSIFLIPVIILGLITIIGTGGGGDGGSGGSSSDISYTGATSQATINESNAAGLTTDAYAGGEMGAAFVLASETTTENKNLGLPLVLRIAKAMESSALQIHSIPEYSVISGATETYSDRIYGSCGGYYDVNVTIDYDAGTSSGSFDYVNYCNDGVILNGNATYSDTFDTVTYKTLTLSFSFNNISSSVDGESVVIKGNISCDLTNLPYTIEMTMLLKDNSTDKVYKVENYEMTFTGDANSVTITLMGRYYDPDYGYVIVSTPQAFVVYDGDNNPSEGILLIVGKTGSEGGNTRARLIAESAAICRIQADTDGDGWWDYDTGSISWTDLYNLSI